MSGKVPSEVLYDSEATLRLVDSAIQDIGELGADEPRPSALRLLPNLATAGSPALGLLGLSDLLARGYTEILGVLDSLRHSRTLLERATVDKLQHTHDKLREVSNATETAATDILNGLDRANAIVDDLDAVAAEVGDDARAATLRNTLRDELFMLMGHMQFQDITSQQLNYASAVLTEMEQRLAAIAQVFDPAALGTGHAAAVDHLNGVHYDPNATTQNREERQAVADEIIANRRSAV